jgi:sec-independent protein translocase protein TatC
LGLVSVKQLRKWRKYAYLLLLVAAAIITPTPDPINLSIVAVPLIMLYEMAILISQVFGKTIIRDQERAEKEAKRGQTDLDVGNI